MGDSDLDLIMFLIRKYNLQEKFTEFINKHNLVTKRRLFRKFDLVKHEQEMIKASRLFAETLDESNVAKKKILHYAVLFTDI